MNNAAISPLRLLAKALTLYFLANVLFAVLQPPVGKLTLYNWLIPGRSRLPFESAENMSKGYNVPLFEDLDANFAAHEIAAPKQKGEYRVILLGDSSVWGFDNPSSETIAAQLNRLGLQTCDGRRIRFYNLGYPKAYFLKDLLILNRAMAYKPDMVMWFVTLYTMNSEDGRDDFLIPHIDEIKVLIDKYHLRNYTLRFARETLLDRTIMGQRSRLKRDILLQIYSFPWASTSIDHYIQISTSWKNSLNSNPDYLIYSSSSDWNKLKHTFMLDVADAGDKMAGNSPIVFINEPIYLASGTGSDIRYNSYYPRWTYDLYRAYLNSWMKEKGYDYVDMWNVVPGNEFTDSPLHLSPIGEKLLAEQLQPFILNYACSSP